MTTAFRSFQCTHPTNSSQRRTCIPAMKAQKPFIQSTSNFNAPKGAFFMRCYPPSATPPPPSDYVSEEGITRECPMKPFSTDNGRVCVSKEKVLQARTQPCTNPLPRNNHGEFEKNSQKCFSFCPRCDIMLLTMGVVCPFPVIHSNHRKATK